MWRVLFPAATPLFAIHNTAHNWEAPHQYRPERWLDVPVEAWVYDSTTNTTGGESLRHMAAPACADYCVG